MRLFLTALFLFASIAGLFAEVTRIAIEGKPQLPIITSKAASPAVKAAAADLARVLGKIAGADFQIADGDGAAGIVVGTARDFSQLPFATEFGKSPFDREEYVLRSKAGALYLIGATDLAARDAVWDLLHRLGYRQFFPGETWEVIPQQRELSIEVDAREKPAFAARRIWYNWGLWGYNNEPYREWCERNRVVQGFKLNSGHAYDAIIAANRAEFERHPEYLAEINGERKLRPDAKFCIANEGLRKLVVNWAVEQVKKSPDTDSISMDPSDGGGWCECQACALLGSVSDRVITLANEVAAAINALGLGDKYVGLYAYNQHCAPPKLRVHRQVIPSATTAFLTGGFTFDQVLRGWQAQGATMGVYDYLSVVDWDWNLPRGAHASRPKRVAELIARIHAQGARFYDAESGDCWGPCGLGYYVASRVLWNTGEAARVDAIIDDFLEKAFGSAREPMREFYHLITADTQRRSPSDLVGRMYRHLRGARAATPDPRVHRRIDDLTLYTRHAELYYAHANGGKPKEDVAAHAYRMRKSMMVHSYGLWARLLSQKDAHTDGHPLKNETPYSEAEIEKMRDDGIAKNQPVEPGFTGVEYSKDLIPAMPRLALATVARGQFPTAPQDRQRYYLWAGEAIPEAQPVQKIDPAQNVPPAQSVPPVRSVASAQTRALDLKVTVKKQWALRAPKLELFSPLAVDLAPVATFADYAPDGQERAVTLRTPHPGLHRLETYDGGDYTTIQWPEKMPVTVESGIDTPDVTSHFRGEWTLYFYVPRGTKIVGGWASRIANWAPRISGKLVAPDGKEMLDFAKLEDGFFKVEVPPGADAALWKFERNHGQRLLMTVPPYLARSGEELLLPREVVEADAR